MNVEMRHGRPYLYDRKRMNGRIRREYLGPLSTAEVTHFRGRADAARAMRMAERGDRDAEARRVGEVLAAGGGFDALADRVFRSVMFLSGYTLHNRGEWRRKRGAVVGKFEDVSGDQAGYRPALIPPPAMRPEDRPILDRAARGDWSALPQVRELLQNVSYRDAVGGAGQMALTALIATAAGSNVAVAVAMQELHAEYLDKLLADGPPPTFAERLAATRAAHSWLAVHVLECLAALRPPASPQAVTIERRVTQAERRLHLALKSLAVLRRLRKPTRPTPVAAAERGPSIVSVEPREARS